MNFCLTILILLPDKSLMFLIYVECKKTQRLVDISKTSGANFFSKVAKLPGTPTILGTIQQRRTRTNKMTYAVKISETLNSKGTYLWLHAEIEVNSPSENKYVLRKHLFGWNRFKRHLLSLIYVNNFSSLKIFSTCK